MTKFECSSSNGNFGIIVDLENYADEEIISSKEDAFRRLRFRSIPLQDGECFHVKEGECVLATHKAQSRRLFFDAVVKKPHWVKHSNRVYCRCTFEIKWLNPQMEGETMTVPSNSLMKLCKKSITSHPTVNEFLSNFSPTNGLDVPSLSDLLEEANNEACLHGLLEKQIEEISKLADKSKEVTEDILWGVKRVNLSSQTLNRVVRRSARNHNKQEVEVELEKHLQEKPFLSPLAARAALASLVNGLPHNKAEISLSHVEKHDHESPLLKILKKNVKEKSLDVPCIFVKPDASVSRNTSVVVNPIQNGYIDPSVEARHLSRSSPSNKRGSMMKSQSNHSPLSSTTQEISAQASKESEGSSITVYPVTGKKLNGYAIERRITRSVIQKEALCSTAEAVKGPSIGDTIPMSSTRLTHSARMKETGNPRSKQDIGQHKLTEDSQDASAKVTPEKEEFVDSTAESVGGSLFEHNCSMSATRLTRSSKTKEVCNQSNKQDRGKSKLTEPEKEEVGKKLIASPGNPEIVVSFNKKRTRVSEVIPVPKGGRGNVLRSNENSPAENKRRVSSKKPELRSSPRLRFLPRTRAQKRSPA